MKLDVQLINHNYITRIVIFSVFLFKKYRKDEKIYEKMVSNFIFKKTRYSINIKLETGPKFPLEEQRNILLDSLLNDDDIYNLNLIVVHYKTPLKEVSMQIDLNNKYKYEEYLYL
jgi:hypothetical protein